ncbi:MAG: hypothetical protein A2X36_12185 [Elusimicrobia bacterium GWA2_69_24]|nr:MAG: hypothetical protein A2X36_12185 [Elusimicrobia bacterium GWA2_69_24]
MRHSRLAATSLAGILLAAAPCLPLGAEDFSFAVFCDSRGEKSGVNEPVLRLLVDHIAASSAAFTVFPGDMVSGSGKDPEVLPRELARWKEIMAPLKVWPVTGNHEMRRAEGVAAYRQAFPGLPANGPKGEEGFTYSFDRGDSHFAVVNTEHWDLGDPADPKDDKSMTHQVWDLDWLRADLEAARRRGARHLFVFGHQPAFPVAEGHLISALPNVGWKRFFWSRSDRKYLRLRDAFWKILADNRVAAYFCGDDHAYGRQSIQGVYQIVTGTAGAPLYALAPCHEPKGGLPQLPHEWLTFGAAKRYYKALGYPHGKGDKCQASNDFVGGNFFGYSVLEVHADSVAVKTWGVPARQGSRVAAEPGAALRVFDEFVIKD